MRTRRLVCAMAVTLALVGCTEPGDPGASESGGSVATGTQDDAVDGATEVAGDAAPGEAMIDPRHESVATLEDFTVTIPPSSTIDGERLVLSAAERAPNLGVSGLRIVDGIAVTLSAGQLVRPLTVTLQVPAPSDEAAVPVALWEGADGVRAVPVSVERDGDAQLITLSTKDLTQGWFGWLEPGPIAEEALAGLSEAYLIKEHTSQPRCTEEDASREIIEVSSDRGDPVLWCAGLGGDLPYVVIANNRLSVLQLAGPVSWTVTGDLTLPIASLTDTFGEVVQPLVSTYPENLTVSLMPPGDSVTLSATEPVQGPVELRARATGLGHLITVLDHGLTTFANISGGLGAPQEWATLSQELLQGRTLGIPAQVIAEWGQCLGGFTEITSREPWQSLEPDEITPVTEHAIDCFAQIAQAGLGGEETAVADSVLTAVTAALERVSERTASVPDLHERIMAIGGSSRLTYSIHVGPAPPEDEGEADGDSDG